MISHNTIASTLLLTFLLGVYVTPTYAAVDLRMNHRDCERALTSTGKFSDNYRCKLPNHILGQGPVVVRVGAHFQNSSLICAIQKTRFGTNELVTLALKAAYPYEQEYSGRLGGWLELSYDHPLISADYYTLFCHTRGFISTIHYQQN